MVRFMVFNATFNNISVISWWSVLLVEGNRNTWRKPLTCAFVQLVNIFNCLAYDWTIKDE
jgi:hypothetical protein